VEQNLLIDMLGRLGCTKIRQSDKNVRTNCPLAPWFHEKGSDSHPSFSVAVNPEGPSPYRCFACGARGTFLGLLYELRRKGKPVDDLIDIAKKTEVVSFEKKLFHTINMFGPEMVRGLAKEIFEVWDEDELSPFTGKVPKYVFERGLTLDTCRTWGLGYSAEENRLIFPVRRRDGKLVGAVGRALDPKAQPRYRSFINFQKSNYLYGEHLLPRDGEKTMSDAFGMNLPANDGVIVVEGFFDTLRLYQLGYDTAVAIMGSHVSARQKDRLLSFGRPVYLMLDWDVAGNNGREDVIPHLVGRVPLFNVKGPEGKDPDDLDDAQLIECLRNAEIILRA